MQQSIVIIPTYNELENIEKMILKVFSLTSPFHILIVDDGSPDGTADVVKKLQLTYPSSLHILERKGKLGLGTAYIAGFRWCIEKQYDFIFEMDCDFSHNPDDLARLQAPLLLDSDVVVGSRYVAGGKVENWPMDRMILSYGASIYVRMITWIGVRDTTAGFIGYKRKVLETIPLDKIHFIGYAFQIEMKYLSKLNGFKISEVPITFIDRVLGQSKMSSGIIKEAVWGVLQMRWWGMIGKYK
jgi:dolichol-phosphate mannosyltransferase